VPVDAKALAAEKEFIIRYGISRADELESRALADAIPTYSRILKDAGLNPSNSTDIGRGLPA